MTHFKPFMARIVADFLSSKGKSSKPSVWPILIKEGFRHLSRIILWTLLCTFLAMCFIVMVLYAGYLGFQALGLSPLMGLIILIFFVFGIIVWGYCRLKDHLFHLKLFPQRYAQQTACDDLLQKRIVLMLTAFLVGFRKNLKV